MMPQARHPWSTSTWTAVANAIDVAVDVSDDRVEMGEGDPHEVIVRSVRPENATTRSPGRDSGSWGCHMMPGEQYSGTKGQ